MYTQYICKQGGFFAVAGKFLMKFMLNCLWKSQFLPFFIPKFYVPSFSKSSHCIEEWYNSEIIRNSTKFIHWNNILQLLGNGIWRHLKVQECKGSVGFGPFTPTYSVPLALAVLELLCSLACKTEPLRQKLLTNLLLYKPLVINDKWFMCFLIFL